VRQLNRPAALLLLIALLLLQTVRGLVPAMSQVDSDFPGYFTAAKIVADGGEVARLYDDAWFNQQIARYGLAATGPGKFEPFPPPTALLLVPLSGLTPLDALRALSCLSVLGLLVCVLFLSRILLWSAVDTGLLVLLSGYAIGNDLRFGQPYVLASMLCILGYYAYLRQRPLLAGLLFGVFLPIKYFPLFILLYFACRRQWRIVAGGAIATLAVVSVSIAVLGWQVHREFLQSVLGPHLLARLRMQDPFAASFQSFDALFRRLFVFDASANPQPLWAAPRLAPVAIAVTKSALFALALATLVRLARREPADAVAPSIGLLGVLTLLLAPATATYHAVILWLPLGLLLDFLLRRHENAAAWTVLGIYSLIGYFPYRFSNPFEGRGALSLLAFPRLWLLLALFLVAVGALWRQRELRAACA
jgi:glycosyl transferase family 87